MFKFKIGLEQIAFNLRALIKLREHDGILKARLVGLKNEHLYLKANTTQLLNWGKNGIDF